MLFYWQLTNSNNKQTWWAVLIKVCAAKQPLSNGGAWIDLSIINDDTDLPVLFRINATLKLEISQRYKDVKNEDMNC